LYATLSIGLVAADPLAADSISALNLLLLNPGAVDASGPLTVVDSLPAGLSYVDLASDGWGCAAVDNPDDGTQQVTCTSVTDLGPGSQTQLIVLVGTGSSVPAAPVNLASVSSPSLDPAASLPVTQDPLPLVELAADQQP
jgi:hypothetical protein